jgi:2'-hydroxyisoflavone reductase
LFPELEKIQGNRDEGLDGLVGHTWDAVIDPSGYVPRIVGASAQLLAYNGVRHYTFISSLSVYKEFSKAGLDETATLGSMADPTLEQVTGESYGPLKVLCEQAAEAALPGGVLAVRAGYIVGPYDPTDRFTYWPRRVSEATENQMLLPLPKERLFQVIDARDLAAWVLHMIETNQTGPYNVTGPHPSTPITMQGLLTACAETSGSSVTPKWVGEQFMKEQGLEVETAFPLCVPANDQEYQYIHEVNFDKALKSGLTLRPLSQTIHDLLEWDATREPASKRPVGLSRERELELLAKLASSQPSA